MSNQFKANLVSTRKAQLSEFVSKYALNKNHRKINSIEIREQSVTTHITTVASFGEHIGIQDIVHLGKELLQMIEKEDTFNAATFNQILQKVSCFMKNECIDMDFKPKKIRSFCGHYDIPKEEIYHFMLDKWLM